MHDITDGITLFVGDSQVGYISGEVAVLAVHSISHADHVLDVGHHVHKVLVGIDTCDVVVVGDGVVGTCGTVDAELVHTVLETLEGLIHVECAVPAFTATYAGGGAAARASALLAFPALKVVLGEVGVGNEAGDFGTHIEAVADGILEQFVQEFSLGCKLLGIQQAVFQNVASTAVGIEFAGLLVAFHIVGDNVAFLAAEVEVLLQIGNHFLYSVGVGLVGFLAVLYVLAHSLRAFPQGGKLSHVGCIVAGGQQFAISVHKSGLGHHFVAIVLFMAHDVRLEVFKRIIVVYVPVFL